VRDPAVWSRSNVLAMVQHLGFEMLYFFCKTSKLYRRGKLSKNVEFQFFWKSPSPTFILFLWAKQAINFQKFYTLNFDLGVELLPKHCISIKKLGSVQVPVFSLNTKSNIFIEKFSHINCAIPKDYALQFIKIPVRAFKTIRHEKFGAHFLRIWARAS